jgi:hypothetical protein
MEKAIPSIQQVKNVLGQYSIAPVRNWLKRRNLTHTMNSRGAMVERVHGLIEAGKLSHDDLIEGAIGIEEASSKRTFIYRISHTKRDLEKIDAQLKALKVPISNERAPSVAPAMTSKLVYALNDDSTFRAKWNEVHIRIKADKRSKTFEESKQPKIIVLIVNKATGEVQLRYDKPDDRHSHMEDGTPSDQAYFDYYREKAENILGLPLEPVDLRADLERVLKAEPRIVRTNYVVDDAEDGSLTKRTQKKQGKDIRDTKGWKSMDSDGLVRTFEESPLYWLADMSGGKLKRELFCYVDAASGFVRFDADCYEDEIDYVLDQLVRKNAAKAAHA